MCVPMSILLLLLILVPLLGAAICAMLPSGRAARGTALAAALATAAAAFALVPSFDFSQDLSQFRPRQQMYRSVQIEFPAPPQVGQPLDAPLFGIDDIGFEFRLGVDSISFFLVLLTVVLMPLAVGASFESIQFRRKEYYAWMLVLLAAMNGVFLSRDVLLFYIFFELTLIPMFFIIGIWGGPERRYAAGKFFLFTFAGSIFTLAAVVYLGMRYNTFDIIQLTSLAQHGAGALPPLSSVERLWILLGFLAGFAVKVPLFPVHTWLPLAHTEAPTAGSVILAGVLLKLGTYGLLRLAVPLGMIDSAGVAFPALVRVLGVLCVVGIIYGALVAWVQQDIKKLVAYSSVSHLGFCVLGLMALNSIGMQGSFLYMINHGISTGAMFLCVGMIYDRFHTRDINELSGLARNMPKLAFFFMLFTMASIGLPGLNGFVNEFLTVLGAFTSDTLGIDYAVFAAMGVILGALYMLHMAARVIWGPLKTPAVSTGGHGIMAGGPSHGQGDQGQSAAPGHDHTRASIDIGIREIAVLMPLAILVVLLGVLPNIVLRPIRGPIEMIRTPVAASPQRPTMAGADAPVRPRRMGISEAEPAPEE
jgi:NADH-quinone oxidoreductase subunit M